MRAAGLLALLLAACAATGERPLNPVYDRQPGKVEVRPFYWSEESERGRRVNILGPLVRWREDHVYRSLQVFPNFFYTERHTPQAQRSWFAVFFPFLFVGSDDFLLFPLGGYSKGLIGLYDFLMVTPLYIRTRVRSSHPTDPETYTVRHVAWPLVAWGSDGKPGGRRKFRIAPFYGRKVGPKGEVSGFFLWPLFTYRRSETSKGFFIFPFYGRDETPTREQTTILFPFYHRTKDLLPPYATDTSVWPFWRRAKGSDGFEVRRAWPIAEYRRAGFTTVEYVAWPFWRRSYVDDGREFARWTWVTPFYRRVVGVSRDDGSVRKKTVVWPLGREFDGD